MWPVFVAVALCMYASHAYAQHQAYKTGVYMGKAFFTTADFQNRQCLRLRTESVPRGCTVNDLNDTAMEKALASAWIIPSMSESEVTAIHTGFRAGWREARTVIVTRSK
jgi:hypothetical protein